MKKVLLKVKLLINTCKTKKADQGSPQTPLTITRLNQPTVKARSCNHQPPAKRETEIGQRLPDWRNQSSWIRVKDLRFYTLRRKRGKINSMGRFWILSRMRSKSALLTLKLMGEKG